MIKEIQSVVTPDDAGKRIDLLLATSTETTRSAVKAHLKELFVNGKAVKLSYKCKSGENIRAVLEWEDLDLVPEDIPLAIVYEDEHYIVINKESGMVVHPAKGNYRGTLVNALLGLKKNLSQGEDMRPGIVHRLDKDTSGLIIITKTLEAHEYLSGLFRERKVRKIYRAILKGTMMPLKSTVINSIGRDPHNRKKMAVVNRGGKESVSLFRVVKQCNNLSYVLVRIKTGRTHQIRVHAAHLGYPVLGDPLYSRKDARFPDTRLCLVASRLTFFDKFSGRVLDFKLPRPAFISELMQLSK